MAAFTIIGAHYMSKIEFEFNYKAAEKAIMDAIAAQIREKVIQAVGVADASLITVKVKGRDLRQMTMDVNGPEELIEKVRKALQ